MDDSLRHRRHLPPGSELATWPAADGWPLGVGTWPDGRRGTLLFLNGRADFLGKYAEALWWWRARGWALCAPDWRGQGVSGRLGRMPLAGHADSFEPWLDDLATIVARLGTWPRPLVAVGHSMGGHLLLRGLVRGLPAIHCAVLTAPMLGLRLPLPAGLARLLTQLVRRAGGAQAILPGQQPGRSPADVLARARLLTSCPERQADEEWWLARHPERRLGGPTWGWLDAAFASLRLLNAPGAIESVRTQLLALLAHDEQVVDNGAAMRTLARLPAGAYALSPGRHELLREADAARLAALRRIDGFLEDGQVGG